MKKILFVINSLTIGGSERSLVSLLNSIDFSKFEVDLLMFKKGEEFEKYVPKEVKILEEPTYYKYLAKKNINLSHTNYIKFWYCKYKTSLDLRLNRIKKNKIQSEQILYKNQKKVLNTIKNEYDVSIAFSQGMPTYFVGDKVVSKRKIAWINCDYVNTKYDKEMDYPFYKKMEKIVVVSNTIKKSIAKLIPEYKRKLEVVLDIINPKLIEKMANSQSEVYKDKSVINILTVGRLITHHKGYDIAVKAAKLLDDNNYKFKWYSIGEGENRKEIEFLINELGLEGKFLLLGKKENPYPYMRECDLYVQPSKKEGFGLTVMEAKILRKPILCTDFNTAKELINNEKDGLIVGQSEEEVYFGIKRYLEDTIFKYKILKELESIEQYSSIKEIEKIYSLIG